MPFNGAGVFNRLYSWTQDAINGIKIRADRMDSEDNGFAAGLTDCVTRDGQSGWLANLPAGGFKIVNLTAGTADGDSLAFNQANAQFGNNLAVGGAYSSEWGNYGYQILAPVGQFGLFSASSLRVDADAVKIGSLAFEFNTNTATYRTRAAIDCLSSGATANKRGGKLSFKTAPDNATTPLERVVIDKDGLVGINTTPVNILDIMQSQNAASLGLLKNANGGVGAVASWGSNNGTHGVVMQMQGTGYTTAGAFRQDGALFYTDGIGGMGFSIPSDAFRWWVGGANVATLSLGTLALLTTLSAQNALFSGTGGASGFVQCTGFGNSVKLDPQSFVYNYGGGFDFVNNLGTGQHLDYTTGNWGNISDEKAKDGLVPITGALDRVDDIRTMTGYYIGDEAKTIQPFMIAQDWEKIAPSLTPKKWKDGIETNELLLAYAQTVTYAFACIKELKQRLTALEQKGS